MVKAEAERRFIDYQEWVRDLKERLQPTIPAGYYGQILFNVQNGGITTAVASTTVK